ncbi:MAG TPA: phage protein Gp36 family protein [Candidatus Binataceae bacterium]|nr:phage protein Gp36 family protein [Candidatus Binataceae bacterium]
MPYAQVSDMQNRYPNRDLVQLTNEDPTQATVNSEFLSTFLSDASAEIDSYLEARFALPFSDPPAILTRLCCEIAMYHLHTLRPIHDLADAKDKYEKCIVMLKEVRDGKLTLGLSVDNQEPADPASPQVVMDENFGGDPTLPQRVFSRGTLKGF